MTETVSLQEMLTPLVIQLRWKQALDRCVAEGRDYTEIHFYTHPETDEIVITYWDINT